MSPKVSAGLINWRQRTRWNILPFHDLQLN